MNRPVDSYPYRPLPRRRRVPPSAILLGVIVLIIGIIFVDNLVARYSGRRPIIRFGEAACIKDAPTPLTIGTTYNLADLYMVSPNEGWTIARSGHDVMLHYTNTQWLVYPFGENTLLMYSASQGWSGGGNGSILEYESNCWRTVRSRFNPGDIPHGTITSMSVVAPNDVWAATDEGFLHYDGYDWQRVDRTAQFRPNKVLMLKNGEGLAFGSDGNSLIMISYRNGSWQPLAKANDSNYLSLYARLITRGPTVEGTTSVPYDAGELFKVASALTTTINSVYMVSDQEGWAVGGNFDYGDRTSTILHYKADSWSAVASPAQDNALNSVYMTSPDEGWAVGYDVILHYTNGRWVDYFAEGK